MLSPLKAIKLKCLDCCCDQANEVKLCACPDCTLYQYRFGKGNKREMTAEQRQASSERMKSMQEAKKMN